MSLHPGGSKRSSSTQQSKRVTNREENAAMITVLIRDNPLFHSPAGQRYPHKIRIRAIDRFREVRLIRFGPAAKRRANRANDLNVRLQFLRFDLQRFQNFVGVAEEKMSPRPRTVLERMLGKVRSVNAVGQTGAA